MTINMPNSETFREGLTHYANFETSSRPFTKKTPLQRELSNAITTTQKAKVIGKNILIGAGLGLLVIVTCPLWILAVTLKGVGMALDKASRAFETRFPSAPKDKSRKQVNLPSDHQARDENNYGSNHSVPSRASSPRMDREVNNYGSGSSASPHHYVDLRLEKMDN